MPYVIKNETVWEKIGHAKAASSQAHVKTAEIQEVRLMLWGLPIAHKPKRQR
jgi:hypothetical protein